MKKKILHKNMQKKKAAAPGAATLIVPGTVNLEGNTIVFVLENGSKLSVYRSAQGQWLAAFEGIQAGK
jgi:hypothetical protein